MIERLRTLPAPLRFAVYIAGALLIFVLALGVGAATAFVMDRRFGMAPGGSVETSTPGGDLMETTGADRVPENTMIEPSGDSEGSNDTVHKSSFVHRATEKNSRGDYTYISDPGIDGDPNAVVLVSRAPDLGSSTAASYDHHIGVWYEGTARKWAIFNQDRAAVPAGTAFRVEVPRASAGFVHRADLLNTVGHYTYLDNQQTNGLPDAVLSVTQNWNPGGGRGVYNNHPIGTQYDARLGQWAIYNRDGAPMPQGAAFNVEVSTVANEPSN